jgi:vacuolar-type H+-ATPase subunit I/STV1
MSQGIETTLRKSLDAVDQRRRRLTWLLMIAGLAVAWQFYRLAQIAQAGDVPRMIVSAVMVLFFSILGVGVLLVFQLTIATRRILRAIELASSSTA